MSLSISHSAHKTKIYQYAKLLLYSMYYILCPYLFSRPFGSQNIWHNNKSASCKRHTKSCSLSAPNLLAYPSYYNVQLQFSDCHNIFYALFLLLLLLLLLLAFVLLWRGQSQMKFAVASLENFTTQPQPVAVAVVDDDASKSKTTEPAARCLHGLPTAAFLHQQQFLQFLPSSASLTYSILRCMDIFRWPANSSSNNNSNTTCNKWKLKESKSNRKQ